MSTHLKSIFFSVTCVVLGILSVFFAREWAVSKLAPSTEVTKVTGKIITVVVSGDMASHGDCHDHYTDGCDLFSAKVDLATGEVTNVKQLTDDNVSDISPVLSQDGKNVFYTKSTNDFFTKSVDSGDSAMKISIDGGTAQTLSIGANHPFPSADGTKVYFTLMKGFFLATLDLTDPAAVFQKIDTLMSTHEPHVSSKGMIGFYRSTPGAVRGSNTSQAMIYIPGTGEIIEASPADGTAHCFWNYDGSALYCNNAANGKGGILSFPVSSDGTVGKSSVAIRFPTSETLEAVDPQFNSDCVSTSVEYGSFCDDTHVLLTAACYTPNAAEGELSQKFTQTVILDTDTGTYLPLGKNLVAAYGSSDGTTWTGACVE